MGLDNLNESNPIVQRLREVEIRLVRNDVTGTTREKLLAEKNHLSEQLGLLEGRHPQKTKTDLGELLNNLLPDIFKIGPKTTPIVQAVSEEFENVKINIGATELRFLLKALGIRTRDDLSTLVLKIKKQLPKESQNGTITPAVLEYIYNSYYFSSQSLIPGFIDFRNNIDIAEKTGDLKKFGEEFTQTFFQKAVKSDEDFIKMRYLIYREYKYGYTPGIMANIPNTKFHDYPSDINFDKQYYGTNDYITRGSAFIDPQIGMEVPSDINSFLTTFGNLGFTQNKGNGIYIMKNRANKYFMFCYQNGSLLFAALTSPGEPKANIKRDGTFETWPGQFSPLDFTIGGVRKDNHIYIDKVAGTTGPMPKATRVTGKMPDGTDIDGIYLHAGPTNGSIASRGCFRLHAFIANLVERKVADGTPGHFRPDIKIS